MTRILGISGAMRRDSTNRKLLNEAVRLFGAADYIEADLNLPLYDGDLEAESGLPEAALKLGQQISEADAVLISTPEYNSGIPGVLKNALDWVSRSDTPVWKDKPLAIMSAAAGRSGGARALFQLRLTMAPFRARLVNGPEVMVAQSYEAFDSEGRLSESYATVLQELMDGLHSEISIVQAINDQAVRASAA